MITYTLLSVLSIPAVLILDYVIKTRLLLKPLFWQFQAVVIVLTLAIDSFSGYRPVIIYNPQTYLGIRLFYIPLENFFFGFSLITLNIILYEIYSRKK